MFKKRSTTLIPLDTPWSGEADMPIPLAEYPRPQLRRAEWSCLNGCWQYAVCSHSGMPDAWDGEIVVPYSPESQLSRARRRPGLEDALWYRRSFIVDSKPAGQRLLLHFGAVDQRCAVWVNQQRIGGHEGGYTPFSFDVTDAVQPGENTLLVQVIDLCDKGPDPYDKQKPANKRGGIWYTGQSGIWQTVWTEWTPANHIEEIVIRPLTASSQVAVQVVMTDPAVRAPARIRITENGRLVARGETSGGVAVIDLHGFRPWTTDDPFLYDMEIAAGEDRVYSYFGMRSFGVARGAHGRKVLTLNGEPIFHHGLLDQGYWSDGLYTPPSDEAMVDDILRMKSLGFNMLRKHIKIEPLRWYYHCDRLGMLVWQDFVSGGGMMLPKALNLEECANEFTRTLRRSARAVGMFFRRTGRRSMNELVTRFLPFVGVRLKDHFPRAKYRYRKFGRRDPEGRACFLRDAERTVRLLRNSVSLCCWVPFNEGWGQFDAAQLAETVRQWDDSRYIDHASGWHDQHAGDFKSSHIYYKKYIIRRRDKLDRVLALTEFGGLSLPTPGHMGTTKKFGYKTLRTEKDLEDAWVALYEQDVLANIPKGLAVDVYTQVSDVEDEINGVMTYDRQVQKLSEETCLAMKRRIDEAFRKAFEGDEE